MTEFSDAASPLDAVVGRMLHDWYTEPLDDPSSPATVMALLDRDRRRSRRRAAVRMCVGAIAAALLVAVITRWPWSHERVPQHTMQIQTPGETIRFVLVPPSATQRVTLVGDFDNWDPAAVPLVRAPAGPAWTVDVRLSAGQYRYAFLVDGARWVADPAAPLSPDDGFGGPTSVVIVGLGGAL